MYKKSLKIPKGQSETVYRRRTDNTMHFRHIHVLFWELMKVARAEPTESVPGY